MKKYFALMLVVILLLTGIPVSTLAAAKQMRDGVPVWTEETVKEYAMDFINGVDIDRLYGYYDLQIRRYMPMDTYTGMLTEIAWMTGSFVAFGTYESFEEPEQLTKTHVLHLCMEKQDLDLYFTHKDKEDDWEVMAVEFVPGEKQAVDPAAQASAQEAVAKAQYSYVEVNVQVGEAPYLLAGILTLPEDASAEDKVPAVVLVHDAGALDMDETVGQTTLFADIAHIFARMGIATLRYDKRTYTYPEIVTDDLTVEEDTVQDAISAGNILAGYEQVNTDCIVLLGHGIGASLSPRIMYEANGLFSAMVLIAGSPDSPLEILLARQQAALESLSGDELTAAQEQVDVLSDQINTLKKAKKADDVKDITVNGRNGYYYWEMMQTDAAKLIKRMKKPIYIVQGNEDFETPLDNGINAFIDEVGYAYGVDYKMFRNLNHMMMIYDGPSENAKTVAEYDTPETLDQQAGLYLADWVLSLIDEE